MEDNTLLDEVGGKPMLEKVHKHFYDELYKHPWLKNYFLHIDQKIIENQQTDFMIANMGGGKIQSSSSLVVDAGIEPKSTDDEIQPTRVEILQGGDIPKNAGEY